MSDIQIYLLEVDKNRSEALSIARQSAAKLENKELKLIDLITSLEEYINNKDDAAIRAKSVGYLADTLENVSPRVLSGQERRLLNDFILGRLEGDVEGVGASARALIALEERGKWDSETAQKVARTFLDHTSPLKQFKLQTDRYAVTQLFDLLLAKYRVAMKKVHEDDPTFMSIFISYFDGEKDPRNLMIVFSILHVPMTEWDVQGSAQDLFEAVFNYFPITFKPPPDDPYGITAQDLKDRLRDCIAANSHFAPYAFPALLDKLDSTSINTKRDVVQTIQACVNSYDARTITLYTITLWDALKFEILNVQEEGLAEEALKALSLMAAKFAHTDAPLTSYLRPIIKECNEHLEDAPTKQSEAAGRILHALASSDPNVADKIAKGVSRPLFELYQGSESITKRRGLLEVYNQIIKAYIDLTLRRTDSNIDILQQSTGDALEAMLRALTRAPRPEVSFRLTALRSLTQLLAIPKILSDTQSHQAVDAVTDVILHEHVEGHGDIRTEAIKALTEMAGSAPNAVRERAIPTFIVELPDVPTDDSSYTIALEAFAQLSTEMQIFDTIVLRLRNKRNAAISQDAPKSYQHALLLALLYAFTYGSPMPNEDGIIRSDYFSDYVEPLIVAVGESGKAQQPEEQTLEVVGKLCNIVLRPQTPHFQAQVYNRNLEWLSAAQNPERATQLTPFLLHYYAALRPEVIDPADAAALLQHQATSLLSETDARRATLSSRFLALLVNKFINPKAMESTLQSSGLDVKTLLSSETSTKSSSTNTNLTAAFAIIKGLLTQGKSSALTTSYLTLLLDRLATTDHSGIGARFATLLAPDDILTKANHCLISSLSKQKTFNQLVPPIINSVKTSATAETKPGYLIALSGILRWLPYSMLEGSLAELVAPLLQSLDLKTDGERGKEGTDVQEVKAGTLAIFEGVLMHDPRVVEEHVASLVTRLLNCTARGPTTPSSTSTAEAPSNNSASVRAKALQCLTLVPKQLRREIVLPYRRQVVKKLMLCLDDPKRSVRGEGVRCRMAWLGMEDEEGGDDD